MKFVFKFLQGTSLFNIHTLNFTGLLGYDIDPENQSERSVTSVGKVDLISEQFSAIYSTYNVKKTLNALL